MATQARRKRIEKILKMLKSAEPPVSELQFRALCAYNLGVSTMKINEYLEILHQLEAFHYEEGVIILNE